MSFVAAPINPAASQRELLVQLLLLVDAGMTDLSQRIQAMSQIVTDTAAAEAALNAKIDTLLGLVQPALDGLRSQLAAAQAQVAALQAGDAADATALQTTLTAANAEATKVQAAIDALSPPPPPPAAP